MIRTVTYSPEQITVSRKEALARLGYPVRDPEQSILEKMEIAEKEIFACADFRACYTRLAVTTDSEVTAFGGLRLKSRKLAALLRDCREVFVFAATIGTAVDRLIAKKTVLSAADGLIADAVASATVEALCDRLNRDLSVGLVTLRRYSPGYGDLSLDTQLSVLNLLDAKKRIGIGLTDSNLMTPSKSVTAIIGIKGTIG